MKRPILTLLMLSIAGLLLSLGCSAILETEVEVTGVALLSDNPTADQSGIIVSTDTQSTTTNTNGEFVITGLIIDDTTLKLTFSKPGYATQYKEINIDHQVTLGEQSGPDMVIYVDTVVLEKLPGA